jgi:hypothetical protein
MNKNIVLAVAGLLILFGLIPQLSNLISPTGPASIDSINVSAPLDPELKAKAQVVVDILADHNADAYRLARLYYDMSTLVSLDGEDEVVKSTEDIRQANRLAGLMLKLDMKGKHDGLADAAQDVVVTAIGDDHVPLNKDLRNKAVEGFKALSWACAEASK